MNQAASSLNLLVSHDTSMESIPELELRFPHCLFHHLALLLLFIPAISNRMDVDTDYEEHELRMEPSRLWGSTPSYNSRPLSLHDGAAWVDEEKGSTRSITQACPRSSSRFSSATTWILSVACCCLFLHWLSDIQGRSCPNPTGQAPSINSAIPEVRTRSATHRFT